MQAQHENQQWEGRSRKVAWCPGWSGTVRIQPAGFAPLLPHKVLAAPGGGAVIVLLTRAHPTSLCPVAVPQLAPQPVPQQRPYLGVLLGLDQPNGHHDALSADLDLRVRTDTLTGSLSVGSGRAVTASDEHMEQLKVREGVTRYFRLNAATYSELSSVASGWFLSGLTFNISLSWPRGNVSLPQ